MDTDLTVYITGPHDVFDGYSWLCTLAFFSLFLSVLIPFCDCLFLLLYSLSLFLTPSHFLNLTTF